MLLEDKFLDTYGKILYYSNDLCHSISSSMAERPYTMHFGIGSTTHEANLSSLMFLVLPASTPQWKLYLKEPPFSKSNYIMTGKAFNNQLSQSPWFLNHYCTVLFLSKSKSSLSASLSLPFPSSLPRYPHTVLETSPPPKQVQLLHFFL